MTPVKTISDFHKHNHIELEKSIRYLSRTVTKEEVEDISQIFYMRIMESNTLGKYDPNAGASFNVYIWRMLGWVIKDYYNQISQSGGVPKNKPKKGKKAKKVSVSEPEKDGTLTVYERDRETRISDLEEVIWRDMGKFDGKLELDANFKMSLSDEERNQEILMDLENFKDYLKNLNEREKKKDRMIKWIEMTSDGYNGRTIAKEFGVSDTMVKDIKYYIQDQYKKWTERIEAGMDPEEDAALEDAALEEAEEIEIDTAPKVKRGRGRPRLEPAVSPIEDLMEMFA